MFILWIIVGVLIGLGFGFWTRTSRDEAIHDSWRARLVQAENTIDGLRDKNSTAAGGAGPGDKGLSVLKEQLLKCQSESAVALAENDRLKTRIAELEPLSEHNG